MNAKQADHTPSSDASETPQWRRVLEERIGSLLLSHVTDLLVRRTSSRVSVEELKRIAALRDKLVEAFVVVVGDADSILADMMTKVVELSKRPTLPDVLGTLELAAAKAPTLTEGNALRDVAARFRRVYGGGR